MPRIHKLIGPAVWLLPLILVCSISPAAAQNPRKVLDDILDAHKGWKNQPVSIEITGTSTRDSGSGPYKATATQQEEILVEFGGKSYIDTAKSSFQKSGNKTTYSSNLSGFGQLDVTGLFLVRQLAQRPVDVNSPEPVTVAGLPARRIRITDKRTQTHFGKVKLSDRVDVFYRDSGLLAAISRTFYEDIPNYGYTLTYLFSDYRESDDVLLPFRIEVYLKNKRIETITVSTYRTNVPAAPSLFAPGGNQ